MGFFGKLRRWFGGPQETPEHLAERRRIEYDRDTIRVSQGRPGQGPMPSTLPPTPDKLDPDR